MKSSGQQENKKRSRNKKHSKNELFT